MPPKISVCIPAYKNQAFLRRGLDALLLQDFSDFEVIVTDDSPTPDLQAFVLGYAPALSIRYVHNAPALGTPANWNKAMKLAKGEWIKLIHDDDWLCRPDALSSYLALAAKHPDASILFSAYQNVDLQSQKTEAVVASNAGVQRFLAQPLYLFSGNIIGPPTTILHRPGTLSYDENLKWVVDFSAYIHAARSGRQFAYTPQILVSVGVSSEQVTKASFRIADVEVPENAYLLHHLGYEALNHVRTFDYYWRLIRNLRLSAQDLEKYELPGQTCAFFTWLIGRQQGIAHSLLKNGFVSKALMMLAYFACPFRKV